MKRAKQPPLGPVPAFVYQERRINDLKQAILRHLEANYPIQIPWIKEYNSLVAILETEKD